MTKRPSIQIQSQTDGAVEDYADERDLDKSEAYEQLLQHAQTFRPLTDAESAALVDWVADHHLNAQTDEERQQAEHLVKNATATAIDGYSSDTPGYAGTLLFTVFGFEETYTLYRYDDDSGIVEEVEREAQK